jgi:hypothetical protein
MRSAAEEDEGDAREDGYLGRPPCRSALEALLHEFDGIAAEPIAGFVVGFSPVWPKCRRRRREFNFQGPEAFEP